VLVVLMSVMAWRETIRTLCLSSRATSVVRPWVPRAAGSQHPRNRTNTNTGGPIDTDRRSCNIALVDGA
jgi:hypothetical protein